jgi:hypothetical protein
MQQSIVKFYCFVIRTLLNMFRALLCPSNCHCSFWFPYECGGGHVLSHVVGLLTNWPWLRTRPPPHLYGNKRLQRQFDGLLMMGIIMPETCSAVSVRQRNKILRLVIASSWVFYLFDWGTQKFDIQIFILKNLSWFITWIDVKKMNLCCIFVDLYTLRDWPEYRWNLNTPTASERVNFFLLGIIISDLFYTTRHITDSITCM